MKKLLFTIIAISIFSFASAQVSFSHAVGAKFYLSTNSDADYSSIGIMYSPRLNVAELGDNATVSIGTHIGLAFEGNSRDGSSSFVYDLPIVAEYNFGSTSSKDNDEAFGFYVGGGYAIHNSSDFDEAISGPVVDGGIRFMIAEKPIDVNFSYLIASKTVDLGLLGSTSINQSIFGVGVQYTLGF